MRLTLSLLGLAASVITLAGCYRVTMPGMSYTAPTGWIREDPTSDHRMIQYRLPGENKEAGDARIVVYYFGKAGTGEVDANIDRWASQFRQPDGRPSIEVAVVEHHEASGLVVHTIQVDGTYTAMSATGERLDQPDRSLHAAVVYTEAGPYYFKVVGPTETVRHWDPSYDALLASFQPEPVPMKSDKDTSDQLVQEDSL
jgi:hypothetical protein